MAKSGGRGPDSGAPKLRNERLSGDVHPNTGVRFKDNGYPDFSGHARESVEVKGLTGVPSKDAPMANKAAGLESTPRGYVWHHVEDGKTMQLVLEDLHAKTGHSGGADLLRRKVVKPAE